MLKIYSCVSVIAAFAMTGCLSTQYETSYDEEASATQSQTRVNSQTPSTYYTASPVKYETLNCPTGTMPHPKSGTCLLIESRAKLPARTYAAVSTTAPNAQNSVRATTRPASAPQMGRAPTRQIGAANYRVKTGDNVYRLARALCVPVSAIQAANGLDSSYAIRIGQGLHLPASQC